MGPMGPFIVSPCICIICICYTSTDYLYHLMVIRGGEGQGGTEEEGRGGQVRQNKGKSIQTPHSQPLPSLPSYFLSTS